MSKKNKKEFNPDDFFSSMSVKDVAQMFDYLLSLDYKVVSLADEITKLNFEIVSRDYSDFISSDIVDYYDFEVDKIV